MGIQGQLKKLYIENASAIGELLRHPSYATPEYIHEGPFLLNPWEREYANSTHKVMIIGKQTDGWLWEENTNQSPEEIIQRSLQLYREYKNASEDSGRMFWRAFNQIVSLLDENANPLSVIWGNLWKYDKFDYVQEKVLSPDWSFAQEILNRLNILQKEIEICQPKVVIFFTSHNNDMALEGHFKGLVHEQFHDDYELNELSRCIHPSLPKHTYRTYHPDYLFHWRPKEKGERYSKIIELIVADITG